MPIFEYICQECHHEFETLVFGRDKAKCPKCESRKLTPQLSVFAVSAKSSAGSSPPGRMRILRRSAWARGVLDARPRLASSSTILRS